MDHLSAGQAGQQQDTGGFVRDALAGQDRTHLLRVSVCPAFVRPNVDEAVLRVAKIRVEESGEKGEVLLRFDRQSSRLERLARMDAVTTGNLASPTAFRGRNPPIARSYLVVRIQRCGCATQGAAK
jgi:hypothetical protein